MKAKRKRYQVVGTRASGQPIVEGKPSVTSAVVRAYKLARRTNRTTSVSRGGVVLAYIHGK